MTVGAWKAIGAAVAAAAIGAGGVAMKWHESPQTVLEQLARDVADIKADVRLLKCNAGFPGDCPGQAAHGP
jgi:hypothetical protein